MASLQWEWNAKGDIEIYGLDESGEYIRPNPDLVIDYSDIREHVMSDLGIEERRW